MKQMLRPDLLFVSCVINLLALAMPVYVIQAITRYLSSGEISSLYALTALIIFCCFSEFVFRRYRTTTLKILNSKNDVSANPNQLLRINFADGRTRSRQLLRHEVSQELLQTANRNLASQIAMLDLVFLPIFIGLIYYISPISFVVFVAVSILALIFVFAQELRLRNLNKNVRNMTPAAQNLVESYVSNFETLRLFSDVREYIERLKKDFSHFTGAKIELDATASSINTTKSFFVSVLIIFIVFSACIQIFDGDLGVGGLIALNILGARTLSQVITIPPLVLGFFSKPQNSLIKNLEAGLPLRVFKNSPRQFLGTVELSSVKQQFIGQKTALYDHFDFVFQPGTTTVITGENGSGKTTLFRILTGGLVSTGGAVLIDGVNLQQIDPDWWRSQLSAVPQDPRLINGTFLSNLRLLKPDLSDDEISHAISMVGLDKFFNQTEGGLALEVSDNADFLSLGIRKRFALARAAIMGGGLVIMDEPTEGLDQKGARIFYDYLNRCIDDGKTTILLSHDPAIIKGADVIVSLDVKPTPKVQKVAKG
jgi:ATP-binding cassette subfamily C protein LapB